MDRTADRRTGEVSLEKEKGKSVATAPPPQALLDEFFLQRKENEALFLRMPELDQEVSDGIIIFLLDHLSFFFFFFGRSYPAFLFPG